MPYLGIGIVLIVLGLVLQAFAVGALASIGWICVVVGVILLVVGAVMFLGARGRVR